jgi:hypothetical protein
MPFIFVKVGYSDEKPLIFNTECTSTYLYDQIKEVAFTKTEAYARKRDAEIRQETNLIEALILVHKRTEPHSDGSSTKEHHDDEEDEGAKHATSQEIKTWQAELERLEALKALRENQAAQLLSGLGGFRDLNTVDAVVELHDKDKDAVPFPLKTDPLVPASDILGHRSVFTLFRANMPVEQEGSDEPELVTVPLSFDVDPEPGPDYGKKPKVAPSTKKEKHGH